MLDTCKVSVSTADLRSSTALACVVEHLNLFIDKGTSPVFLYRADCCFPTGCLYLDLMLIAVVVLLRGNLTRCHAPVRI